MGSSSSSMNHIPRAQELMQETGFSAAHLLRLYERFEFLDRSHRGELRAEDFGAVRELAMNPIGDRIIGAFFSPGQETLDFPTFVQILSHFRPTDTNRARDGMQQEPASSRTRKLKFAFQLYDQDRDGKISREELLQVLRAMLEMQVTEEQLQSIAERAIQEADLDKDDAISFEEFRKVSEAKTTRCQRAMKTQLIKSTFGTFRILIRTNISAVMFRSLV
ncbi:calcineurin B homologous protein 2 isoform X2 [Mastacembelus armatus]|uniref:calcineurin B homologous protein 2 isoform X2 n=1 Tax=Mastacembelus armatus TaxID=205130 RepID=UPI000E45916E|nr:calcineurin B homologous protein 2-like isoform X2 [Mastacembelus armatus]